MKSLLSAFLTLGPLPPANVAAVNMESDGAMVPYSALVGALNSINGFSIGEAQTNFQSSAAAAITLTGLQGLYQKLTNGGAVVVTLDSAFNIVNSIAYPFLGQSFSFSIFSSGAGTVATPTLLDGAVTLSGTTSIVAGNRRTYQGLITQLNSVQVMPFTAGSTFTSIAQSGTTNNFTVTLGTNALVPVVGQLFPITVTAGTLPSGLYPINFVTSATSFRIATPPGTVWTATSANLTFAAPPPLANGGNTGGVYSPLMTITAMESVAAVV